MPSLGYRGWGRSSIAGFVILFTSSTLSAAGAAPAPSFVPTSQYAEQEVQGWRVRVNRHLLTDQRDLGARALRLLDRKLLDIKEEMPAPALTKLQKVTLWLGVNDGHAPCAEYHPSRQWLVDNGYNPDKAKSVEIGNATRFLEWSKDQPAMILHELCHAYHDQVLGYAYAPIKEAYKAAVESKRYESVKRNNGRMERHYALTDEKEYFAECCEAFFSRNDFYPFERSELEQFDPQAAGVVREALGVK
jgi:hypothetical protein